MKHYNADIDAVVKAVFKGKEVTRPALFEQIKAMDSLIKDPAKLFQVYVGINSGDKQFSPSQTLDICTNATNQLMWEASALFRGVEIYVDDVNLIECMLRTDIDAIMGDVRMPFPICEFIFPDGVSLGFHDYEVTGCLICDARAFNIYDYWHKYFAEMGYAESPGPSPFDTVFFTRLVRQGKSDTEGVSWLRFDRAATLDVPQRTPVTADDSHAAKLLVKLVFGLCLYLQTAEGRKALIDRPHTKRDKFLGPQMVKVDKARQRYQLRDMITASLREPNEDSGGSHSSPKAHWRKLHMRSLRHEKYRRNDNGSIRVIWVRPALINAAEDEQVIGARKL